MSRESRYGEALGIASRIVSRLDTGSYNSVPDKDVKALADAVILMHSALSETGEHICQKCGVRVEPHRCGGEDAAF